MKIDHIALYTNNLEEIKHFYINYFDAQSNKMYHNSNTGLKTYFLSFEDGSKLEIMTRPNIKKEERDLICCGYIHLAFSVGTKEKVEQLTQRLRNDGFTVVSQPRTTGDGHYESCILDPDGNQIEIVE